MKKKLLLLIGPLLVLMGAYLLYLLVLGLQAGALLNKSSYIEWQTNPIIFCLLAGIYGFAALGCLLVGALLSKELLSRG